MYLGLVMWLLFVRAIEFDTLTPRVYLNIMNSNRFHM